MLQSLLPAKATGALPSGSPDLLSIKKLYTKRVVRNSQSELAGAGGYPWDWILRVPDQEDGSVRLDKRALLSGGTFSYHGV